MIKGATEQTDIRVTGLVYKEEGDTRERCGPLYKRLSDGSLQNFMDAQSEPKLREDGTPFAAWFRPSQVRRFAKQEKLPLEMI